MKLTLRIVGIHEQEDYSREARIDEALSSIPTPHTKEVIESLYENFPSCSFVMLDVRVKDEKGKEIGSLAMLADQWPTEIYIGAELEFTA